MTNENRLEKLRQEAEAKAEARAKAIIDEICRPDIEKLDSLRAKSDQLAAEQRELKRVVERMLIVNGLHPRMCIAASHGKRVDPVQALNDGVTLNRFNERN